MKISASAHGLSLILAAAASLAFIGTKAVAQPNLIQRGIAAQADPAYEAARRWFEALSEAERRAIQDALVWTGDYNGASDGNFGKRTRDAIAAFAARAKKPADGTLDNSGKAALLAAAGKARAGVRFTVLPDQRTGIRIGVPQALMPKSRPAGAGTMFEASDGSASLSTDVASETELAALFARLTAGLPDGRVTYKLLRPDFLVVSGENSGRSFYTRYGRGEIDGRPALRGFTLTYPASAKASFDRMTIAVANSFEPFPSTIAAAPPGIAAPAAGTAPLQPLPPYPASAVATGVVVGQNLVLTSYAGCARPMADGRPATLRKRDETSGLTLFEVTGVTAKPVRVSTSEGGAVIVLAFAPRMQPGSAELQVSAGELGQEGGKRWVAASLQQPGAGAAIFARGGGLIGFATLPAAAVPRLVAAIVPQNTYALVLADSLVASSAVPEPGEKTAGEIVASLRAAILPVTCAAP